MPDSLIYNPKISHFNPVQLPEPIPFWPMTLGWYIIAALLAAIIIFLVIWRIRKWQKNKYRRIANKVLIGLEDQLLKPETRQFALIQLAELLKRVALTSYSREKVAGLTGKAWLEFLTDTAPFSNFQEGAGLLLLETPYQSQQTIRMISLGDIHELIMLSRKWIGGHRV